MQIVKVSQLRPVYITIPQYSKLPKHGVRKLNIRVSPRNGIDKTGTVS